MIERFQTLLLREVGVWSRSTQRFAPQSTQAGGYCGDSAVVRALCKQTCEQRLGRQHGSAPSLTGARIVVAFIHYLRIEVRLYLRVFWYFLCLALSHMKRTHFIEH